MKKVMFMFCLLSITAVLMGCSNTAPMYSNSTSTGDIELMMKSDETSELASISSMGEIYLYGEIHGEEKILEEKFNLWNAYYHDEGMRHLFIELPYYTAEFLNLWMQADDDEIFDRIYREWGGTLAQNPSVKDFYQKIKKYCPETIFHGTDVGHQYSTTGFRFLRYLKENNLEETLQYVLTREAIEQGHKYYANNDHVYRENTMVKNFIREFDSLDGERIMGSYGAAHTGLDTMLFNNSVPSMAKQLKAYYGKNIYSEDLSYLAKQNEPERVDVIEISGKHYSAEFFGKRKMTGFEQYTHRSFWRIKDAYEDFSHYPLVGNVLPYNNYPMILEKGQVFVLEYTLVDGTVEREYHRSDGVEWQGMKVTSEFKLD